MVQFFLSEIKNNNLIFKIHQKLIDWCNDVIWRLIYLYFLHLIGKIILYKNQRIHNSITSLIAFMVPYGKIFDDIIPVELWCFIGMMSLIFKNFIIRKEKIFHLNLRNKIEI